MTNIYFLLDESSKAVKIGRSNNPEVRMDSLQVGNANNLKLVYLIKDIAPSMEKHIHGVCRRYHIKGEWFRDAVLEHHLLTMPYYKENMIKV